VKTVTEAAREVPVLAETNVIVVGGGPAGIGAALASARNGAKTILIEQANCLGGLQTQCLNPRFTEVDTDIHGGIIMEIVDAVEKGGALLRPRPTRHVRYEGISFDPEFYKFLLDGMMAEAGVKLYYHAFAVGAIRNGSKLEGIFIESKEGRQAVLGKAVIDCSGSADIAWKSGAACMADGFPRGSGKGRHMGFGYAVTFREVDIDRFEAFRTEHPDEWKGPITGKNLIKKAKEEGRLYGNRGAFWFTPHFGKGTEWILGPHYALPMGHHGWLLEDLTAGEMDMRKQAWSAYRLLKDRVPGFEQAHIDQLPTHMMLRDSHRMLGEYVLTEEDMRQGRAFDDSVAISNHAPDVFGPDDQHEFIGNVPPYDIPYRALLSRDIDNLLAAGSAMSTDFITFAATRYCTPSICTGQAAGTAAALAVKTGVAPKKLDVKPLLEALNKQGVRTSVKFVAKAALDDYAERTKRAQRASMGPA